MAAESVEQRRTISECHLTDSQQSCLQRLLRHGRFSQAFYELRYFPGLWSGFQLGNMPNLIALQCDDVSGSFPLLRISTKCD